MQREFESLIKQANEMTKLASPVYPELDPATENALWAQAEKNVPNPGIPSRFSDEVKEIAYPLAGLGAGVAGYKVTNPLAERAVAKFAPTHAANPRSALNLAAVGVPALLPLAGMFGGIKASEANQKQNNIARYNHSNNVEQAYYDLREKMAGDFAGLVKRASEMTKLAKSIQEPTKYEVELAESEKLLPIVQQYRNQYYSDDFNQAEQAYNQKVDAAKQANPFVKPEMTTSEIMRIYGPDALGLGAGLLGSYGILRGMKALNAKKPLDRESKIIGNSLAVASPLAGWGLGSMNNNTAFQAKEERWKRTNKAESEYQKQIHDSLRETPEYKRLAEVEHERENIVDEYYNHPQISEFGRKYYWSPDIWE